MKKIMNLVVLCVFALPFSVFAQAAAPAKPAEGKACTMKEEAKLRDHMEKHVTYPTTGAKIKEACKKEAPNEFTKEDRDCFEAKITDATTYKTASDVLTALGVKAAAK